MYRMHTATGFPLDEVVSALQKEIRRGNEVEALYWALEMVPRYEQYLWQRLVTIVNEDIGIANPLLLVLVPSQRDEYFTFLSKHKAGNARLVLSNTILLMCRSEKCRMSDTFHCVVDQQRLHGERLEIPDYAHDKHTARGRSMKRGMEHWLEEGSQLLPPSVMPDPYEAETYRLWTSDFIPSDFGTSERKRPAGPQPPLWEEG